MKLALTKAQKCSENSIVDDKIQESENNCAGSICVVLSRESRKTPKSSESVSSREKFQEKTPEIVSDSEPDVNTKKHYLSVSTSFKIMLDSWASSAL